MAEKFIIKKVSEGKSQNRITVPKNMKGYVCIQELPSPDKFLRKVAKKNAK